MDKVSAAGHGESLAGHGAHRGRSRLQSNVYARALRAHWTPQWRAKGAYEVSSVSLLFTGPQSTSTAVPGSSGTLSATGEYRVAISAA
jgi:hypothetical protein